MATTYGPRTVSFYFDSDARELCQAAATWLSCNGEVWGVGPTLLFASAAALFLCMELQATIRLGDQPSRSLLEKALLVSMVSGMLALLVHIWVCSTRLLLYYLDTVVKDSPAILLEMTTATILSSQAELVALGPFTKFLRQQQPQIHITVCWFLALCYADYVRKSYGQHFRLPYLETWQQLIQERASRGVTVTLSKMSSVLTTLQDRIRGVRQAADTQTSHTSTARWAENHPWSSCLPASILAPGPITPPSPSSHPRARKLSKSCDRSSSQHVVPALAESASALTIVRSRAELLFTRDIDSNEFFEQFSYTMK